MSRLVSVVVPAFNEEACIGELATRLRGVAATLCPAYAFEFIIVENGSVDSTYAQLLTITGEDSRFRVIRLSRNFGMEGAVTAGLRKARGDAAVIMCADLQDPPELIPKFIEYLEQGYDNIYGRIIKRSDEGRLRQYLTRIFYWLLHRANDGRVPQGVSDFRMVSRRMYRVLNALPERHRMLRAMWSWIGFRSIGVPYVRPPRHGGRSTYALLRNIYFALHGIASSTTTPLKLIPIAGLSLSGFSFVGLLFMSLRWVMGGVPFNGFGTIVALQLGLFGLLFLLLGVLSEYVGMIFEEVRARPMYVVETEHGFEAEEASTNGRTTGAYASAIA